MFNNVGRKIKGLAWGLFFALSTSSFIAGIVVAASYTRLVSLGLLIALVGPVAAWILSWFIYGYGELICKASAIEKNTRKEASTEIPRTIDKPLPIAQQRLNIDPEKLKKMETLRAQGFITEEEYRHALAVNQHQ